MGHSPGGRRVGHDRAAENTPARWVVGEDGE